LDANIILDFTLKRNDYTLAKQIIELVVTGRVQAYITPSIIHISGYWLTKVYGSKKAKELLLTLLSDVKVIDHDNTISALNSKIDNIEDALQYYTALHHRLDYFILRDKGLKKASMPLLPVFTPEDFLKEFK
jgi:predicted nucleic acid-binding protein